MQRLIWQGEQAARREPGQSGQGSYHRESKGVTSRMDPRAMPIAIREMPTSLRLDAEGVVRIGDEGVSLDVVVDAFNRGEAAEEVAQTYPSLELADVYCAFAYYLRYRPAVDAYLQEHGHH